MGRRREKPGFRDANPHRFSWNTLIFASGSRILKQLGHPNYLQSAMGPRKNQMSSGADEG
jgi:hypothetical protein